MPCSYLNYVQQALYLVVHSLVGPLQGIETCVSHLGHNLRHHFTSYMATLWTLMSSSSVKTIGGAGFRCDAIKGSSVGKLQTTAVECCEPVYCAGGTHKCPA
ncbi:hypothetical protein EMCRGX_G022118 [Ephydatia muelleri]